jgi:transcription initiation factor IIE alpha subunit
MATVIGVDEAAKKRATCRNCASVLEYMPSEVRELWSGTDYGGGPDGARGFTCPKCGENVITERW